MQNVQSIRIGRRRVPEHQEIRDIVFESQSLRSSQVFGAPGKQADDAGDDEIAQIIGAAAANDNFINLADNFVGVVLNELRRPYHQIADRKAHV